MTDILELAPEPDGMFEAELGSQTTPPRASPRASLASRPTSVTTETPRLQASDAESTDESIEESLDTPRTGSMTAIREKLKADEAYKKFLQEVEKTPIEPPSQYHIPKLPMEAVEQQTVDTSRKSILGTTHSSDKLTWDDKRSPSSSKGEPYKPNVEGASQQEGRKTVKPDFASTDIRERPDYRESEAQGGARPKTNVFKLRTPTKVTSRHSDKITSSEEHKYEWRSAPSREERRSRHEHQREYRTASSERRRRHDSSRSRHGSTYSRATGSQDRGKRHDRDDTYAIARRQESRPDDRSRSTWSRQEAPRRHTGGEPKSSIHQAKIQDVDERRLQAQRNYHDRDERAGKFPASLSTENKQSTSISRERQEQRARQAELRRELSRGLTQGDDGRDGELAEQARKLGSELGRITPTQSSMGSAPSTPSTPAHPNENQPDPVSGLYLMRAENTRAPPRIFNIASAITHWVFQEVFRLPPPFAEFDTGAPNLGELPSFIPRRSKLDTLLRRRLQSPWLSLRLNTEEAIRPIDENMPKYSAACGRCSQEHLNQHDVKTCKKRDKNEYTDTIICPYCLSISATRAEYDRHFLRCYGRGEPRRTARWRDNSLAEVRPIRPRKCTVHGCSWKNHIFSIWLCHNTIHRFLALCYNIPRTDQRIIFMGRLYDWVYVERTREYLPPLATMRLVTTLMPFVKGTCTLYDWQVNFNYWTPYWWDNPNNRDPLASEVQEPWPSCDDLKPYMALVSFKEIIDVTQPGIVNSLQQVLDPQKVPKLNEWGSRTVNIERKVGTTHIDDDFMKRWKHHLGLDPIATHPTPVSMLQPDTEVSTGAPASPKWRSLSEADMSDRANEFSDEEYDESAGEEVLDEQEDQLEQKEEEPENVLIVSPDDGTVFTCNVDRRANEEFQALAEELGGHASSEGSDPDVIIEDDASTDEEELQATESESDDQVDSTQPAEEPRGTPVESSSPEKLIVTLVGGAEKREGREVSWNADDINLTRGEAVKSKAEKKKERKQRRREKEREKKAERKSDGDGAPSTKEKRRKKKLAKEEEKREKQKEDCEGPQGSANVPPEVVRSEMGNSQCLPENTQTEKEAPCASPETSELAQGSSLSSLKTTQGETEALQSLTESPVADMGSSQRPSETDPTENRTPQNSNKTLVPTHETTTTQTKRTNEMLTPTLGGEQQHKRARSNSDEEDFTALKQTDELFVLSHGMDSSGYTTPRRASMIGMETVDIGTSSVNTATQAVLPPGFETDQHQEIMAALRLGRQKACRWGEVPRVKDQDIVFSRENFMLCRVMRAVAEPSLTGMMRRTTTGESIKHVMMFGQLSYELMSVEFGTTGTSRAILSKGGAPKAMIDGGVSVTLWELRGLRQFVGILYFEDDVSDADCVGLDSDQFTSVMVDCL